MGRRPRLRRYNPYEPEASLSRFNNFAQIYHRDTIGDMFDGAQIMGNK
jgi:hypothetical protein